MTIDLMGQKNSSDLSKGMAGHRRKNSGSEQKVLKKIGQADAVNKGIGKKPIGTMGRINDRDQVKLMRNPAKFNAQTMSKEYGGKK